MNRTLYAVCPCCGRRAEVRKLCWNYEEEETSAVIRCMCGLFRVPYSERRIIPIDLNNPYMPEEHFDLLVPAGWHGDIWNRLSRCMPCPVCPEERRLRA